MLVGHEGKQKTVLLGVPFPQNGVLFSTDRNEREEEGVRGVIGGQMGRRGGERERGE